MGEKEKEGERRAREAEASQMLASARRDGTSLRPRRDLYKKARWQPVVPEPRPAFIRTFLSIFRAGQKTSRNQFGRRHT